MRILIAGCGRVGARLGTGLDRSGHHVCVVDPDADALSALGGGFRGLRVVGSGLDETVLLRARVRDSDGFAATTGSDEVNIVLARAAARVHRVPRVVARVVDPAMRESYRHLGIVTIAPVPWEVERLTELLTLSHLDPVASLGSGEVEIVDVRVPALLAGRPLDELTVPGETRVVAVTRAGRTFVPSGRATPLQAGDLAHVAVAVASAARLEQLVGHAEGRG